MRFSELLDDLKIPTKAHSWVRKMEDGDTFVIGKFSIANPDSTHRAQAIIMKECGQWVVDTIWSFPPVFEPAKIYSRFSFTTQGSALAIEEGSEEDVAMCKEVIRRIALHQQTMNDAHRAEYTDKGFNSLYACLWLDSGGISKSAVFKEGDLAQPIKAKFKHDFIHRTMINEKSDFDYFALEKSLIH